MLKEPKLSRWIVECNEDVLPRLSDRYKVSVLREFKPITEQQVYDLMPRELNINQGIAFARALGIEVEEEGRWRCDCSRCAKLRNDILAKAQKKEHDD